MQNNSLEHINYWQIDMKVKRDKQRKRVCRFILLLFVVATSTGKTNAFTGLNKRADCMTLLCTSCLLSDQFNTNHEDNAVLLFNGAIDKQYYKVKIDEDEPYHRRPAPSNFSADFWLYSSLGLYGVLVIVYFTLFQQKSKRNKK